MGCTLGARYRLLSMLKLRPSIGLLVAAASLLALVAGDGDVNAGKMCVARHRHRPPVRVPLKRAPVRDRVPTCEQR